MIAVAGAHGKTTVTGMITLMLLEAGLDPTFIVGGVIANLATNARAGSGKHFMIEADEYRSTFLALKPTIAVVTNVEFDHPDCFPSPRFVRLAFGDFVDNIREGGTLVACNDDEVAHAIGASYHANGGDLMLYGQNEGVGLVWRAADIQPNDQGGVSFTAMHERRACGRDQPARARRLQRRQRAGGAQRRVGAGDRLGDGARGAGSASRARRGASRCWAKWMTLRDRRLRPPPHADSQRPAAQRDSAIRDGASSPCGNRTRSAASRRCTTIL